MEKVEISLIRIKRIILQSGKEVMLRGICKMTLKQNRQWIRKMYVRNGWGKENEIERKVLCRVTHIYKEKCCKVCSKTARNS